MRGKEGVKIIAQNRKARHDYFIEDTVEAGIALIGTEVKSLRLGRANLGDAYAEITGGEVFLQNAHIAQYDPASRFNHDPLRPRRLLLHKREIRKLQSKVAERGYTLVPLSLYFRDGRVKVELALAKGRKAYDKREAIRDRDVRRDMDRSVRERMKE
ncbi:MAG: SsrA-binding protein SmpB [Bacillota bacterium]|jgi:SsrA-binding protein